MQNCNTNMTNVTENLEYKLTYFPERFSRIFISFFFSCFNFFLGNSENISICVQIIDKYPLTHSVIYIHKGIAHLQQLTHAHTHTQA